MIETTRMALATLRRSQPATSRVSRLPVVMHLYLDKRKSLKILIAASPVFSLSKAPGSDQVRGQPT